RCILDAVVAHLYGLDDDDFHWHLRDCGHPVDQVTNKTFARTLDPKGFWRGSDAMAFERTAPRAPPSIPANVLAALREPPSDAADPAGIRAFQARRMQAQYWKVYADWRYANPDRSITTGVTGLSLLAFLGAGHTESAGEYKETVRNGLYWLESVQDARGAFADYTYGHAIATLALVEAHAMGANHREAAERGVRELLARQSKGGGWDYYGRTAADRSDTSITCWCVMALKSARDAGFDVPQAALDRALGYFRRAGADSTDAFRIVYSIKLDPPTRTAAAARSGYRTEGLVGMTLSTLAYLGVPTDSPFFEKGAALLAHAGPPEQDLYGLYYGTLAMFQRGGEPWRRWNGEMQRLLFGLQVRSGADAGSVPDEACVYGPWYGGRAYATAMTALCLEVYYRYLSVYDGFERPAAVGLVPAEALGTPAEILAKADAEEAKGEISSALALHRVILERHGQSPEAAKAAAALARIERGDADRRVFAFAKAAKASGNPDLARRYLERIRTTFDPELKKEIEALEKVLPPPQSPPEGIGATATPKAPDEPSPPPSREEVQSLRSKIDAFERAQAPALAALRREHQSIVRGSSGKRSEAFLGPWRKIEALYRDANIPEVSAERLEAFYRTDAERRVWAHNRALEPRLTKEEYRFVLLLNHYRLRLGLSPLRIDLALVEASRKHDEEMSRLGYFAHDSPVEANATPWKRAKNEGTSAHGEVLFYGRGEAREALSAWQFSPGHHQILVMAGQRLGVGLRGVFWTAMVGNDQLAAYERIAPARR
ncbi:MAG: CAP domain-containing protein, partial [Planctomycetota bacterium]